MVPLATCLLLTPSAARTSGQTFEIRSGQKGNLVTFLSKAPLESFEGKTRQVSGIIRADLTNLSDSVEVYVEVDLASLDTGIGKGNEHMRNNHLETDRYPLAVFRGHRILDPPKGGVRIGKTAKCRIAGEISVHGIARPLEALLELRPVEKDGLVILQVKSEFDLKLSDHRIKRPQFLIMKLSDVQHIIIEAAAAPQSHP